MAIAYSLFSIPCFQLLCDSLGGFFFVVVVALFSLFSPGCREPSSKHVASEITRTKTQSYRHSSAVLQRSGKRMILVESVDSDARCGADVIKEVEMPSQNGLHETLQITKSTLCCSQRMKYITNMSPNVFLISLYNVTTNELEFWD